jgi:hypothetical protein
MRETRGNFEITPEQAMKIIKREDPDYHEKDRAVHRKDGKLECTLLLLRVEDGKYCTLSYNLENKEDPFDGEPIDLMPCF